MITNNLSGSDLSGSNQIIARALRIAIGDLAGNISLFKDGLLQEPRRCLLAGLDYDTPWTRDAAFNTWYGLGLLAPDVAKNTLLSVLTRESSGDIRIGGQYWDAIIWAQGVWQYYLYTADHLILETALAAVTNSLTYFEKTEFDSTDGLFRGGACFQDGVAGYPDYFAPRGAAYSGIMNWVELSGRLQTHPGGGIPCKALSTNCLYYRAYLVAGLLARELGRVPDPAWQEKADCLRASINKHFWRKQQGTYAYLIDAPGDDDRQEGLGLAFALLFGIADDTQAKRIFETVHLTPHGMPCVWPTYERYAKHSEFGRHSGTIWPQVNAAWALACLARGRRDLAGRELVLLAQKACRDSEFVEVYHPMTGAPYGGIQEEITGQIESYRVCHRQSWCASGYIAMALFYQFDNSIFDDKPLAPSIRAKLAASIPKISVE